MKNQIILLTIIILCFLSDISYSQVNNYQSNQVGARSSMLGGAVVGYTRDNSAIYYNPSGLAFIENSSLSVMGDGYGIEYLYKSKEAGDNTFMRSLGGQVNSQIVSGILKSKKNPILTINYAIINVIDSRYSMSAKGSGQYDVFSDLEGLETYSSVYEHYNAVREDWIGAGWGYKISERLGIGFSLFVTLRNQSYRENVDINIADTEGYNPFSNLIANHTYYNSLYYFNTGVLGKIGLSYEFDRLKLGGTITFPRATIPFLSSSTLNRSTQYFVDKESINLKRSYYKHKVKNTYRSPLQIDLGLKYLLNQKNHLYLSASYYERVNKYNILKTSPSDNEIDKILAPNSELYYVVNEANRSIINLSVGSEHKLNDELTLLLGFNTDFNFLDKSILDRRVDFVPSNNTIDIYHASGGIDWKMGKFNLSLGIRSSFGHSYNEQQFVNFSTPNENNLLLGDLQNNVRTDYFKSMLLVGFTYLFPRI